MNRQAGDQVRCPGTRCQDQRSGLVTSPVGRDLDCAIVGGPGDDGLVGLEHCTAIDGTADVCRHRVLDKQESTGRFPDRFEFLGDGKSGKVVFEPLAGHVLQRQAVFGGGKTGAGNRRAIGMPGQQQSAAVQQRLPEVLGEFVPQSIGFDQQRDVIGMFEIRLASDTGVAVRTAAIVGDTESLQPQHVQATGSDAVQGAATEATDSNNDAIELFAHRSAARLTRTSSLSLRAKTLLWANAGWDQMVIRRRTFRVGSTSLARLISW